MGKGYSITKDIRAGAERGEDFGIRRRPLLYVKNPNTEVTC